MLRRLRKKLAIMISFVLLVISFAPSYAAKEGAEHHWAENIYEDFLAHQLVLNDSEEMLSKAITFNALEEMLSKALGEDVSVKAEVLDVTLEENFVKRGKLAEVIVKVLHMQMPDDTTAIEFLREKGIFKGYLDGTLKPNSYATFGEAITLLDRTFGRKVLKDSSDLNEEKYILGNVLINREDFILKDLTINGDLFIAPGIGESDFTLDGVTLQGKVYVLGGGSESIHLNNSIMASVIVNKQNDKIRINLTGNTKMNELLLTSGGNIENNSSVKDAIKKMNIRTEEGMSIVQLSGNYPELNIYSPVELSTKGKVSIKNMVMNKGAVGEIILSKETVTQTSHTQKPHKTLLILSYKI